MARRSRVLQAVSLDVARWLHASSVRSTSVKKKCDFQQSKVLAEFMAKQVLAEIDNNRCGKISHVNVEKSTALALSRHNPINRSNITYCVIVDQLPVLILCCD